MGMFKKGVVNLVIGQTGCGKTELTKNFIEECIAEGKGVLLISASTEMELNESVDYEVLFKSDIETVHTQLLRKLEGIDEDSVVVIDEANWVYSYDNLKVLLEKATENKSNNTVVIVAQALFGNKLDDNINNIVLGKHTRVSLEKIASKYNLGIEDLRITERFGFKQVEL